MPPSFTPHFIGTAIGWAALGLASLSLPAQAEKADRDQPMRIEADTMRHDESKQLTQFTGQVLATKGTLVLRADRMEVQQNPQGQQVARLWAAPEKRVFFRQKREGLNEFTEGEAESVVYDNQNDVITLMQRAEVRMLRGNLVADQIQGQTIVFDNSTEVVTVDGRIQGIPGAPAQRVRATLTPRQNQATSTTPPPGNTVLRSSPALAAPQKP